MGDKTRTVDHNATAHTAHFCAKCDNLYNISSSNGKAIFVCDVCGNSEPIASGTLISSRKSHDISRTYQSFVTPVDNIVNVPTLPRTRDYICPNVKCQTHIKPGIRDAVMSRMGNSMKMMYICTICKTSWK